jgi:hypothetical protein
MNRVETTQTNRVDLSRGVEQIVADSHEADPSEQLPGPHNLHSSMESDSSNDLCPGQGTGAPDRLMSEEALKIARLLLANYQFHER